MEQIRAAVAANVERGIVLADAAGINTEFRDGLTGLGLQYVVGVQSSMTVWEPGKKPLPPSRAEKWDDLHDCYSVPPTIDPSPSSNWRWPFPPPTSRRSLGRKA